MKDTAISEIRPWMGSEVSVAQFTVTRQLKAINLTPGHGKSSWGGLTLNQVLGEEELDAEAKERAVWTDIDSAFSRPVTRSDESEHYIPTRILAELFQEAGFDAMVYRSQFGPEGKDGHNIAIFELGDAEILNCAPYQVHNIQVKSKQTGNPWFSRSATRETDEP
ncbi:MAG: RES family NAD+ phosphorylase [Chloroflexota bacterium]|nr:RES family NAD+ phosphorylase [Chloroflexota bacterium]